MSWRPEGWKNTHEYLGYISREPVFDIMTGEKVITQHEKIFEDGAEAMLEALRKNPRWQKNSFQKDVALIHEDGTVTLETTPEFGKLVFIPDD